VNTRNELIKQHHRLGSTMIYVTHDQVEAMTMGTRICVMNGGRVAQIGAPLEVYWQPADTFVARFLGSPPMNLFTVPLASSGGSFHVESAAIRAPLSRWAAATLAPSTGRPIILGVRAADLYLDAAPLGAEEKGSIRGTAFAVEPLGAETLLVIETEDGVECTARLSRDIRVSPGETIELFFGARSVYLFDAESGKAITGDMPGFVAGVLPGRMSGSLQ
jgi:multiple sugar transport system ATP-binding protein